MSSQNQVRVFRALSGLAVWMALSGSGQSIIGQQSSVATQRQEMKKLEYMAGEWYGTGWIEMDGKRMTFAGTERVQKKLEGVALLVEGLFKSKDTSTGVERTIHETLAVLSYDERTKTHRFRSWLATGNSGDHEVKVTNEGWQWGLQFPNGSIRYTIKINEKGEWHEIGEISQNGKPSQQFFEMNLKRVK